LRRGIARNTHYKLKSPINTQLLDARQIKVADEYAARSFNPGVPFSVTPVAVTLTPVVKANKWICVPAGAVLKVVLIVKAKAPFI
jgi:hypothetical protein